MSSIKSKEELDHSPPSVSRVDGEKPEATFVEDVEAAGYSEVYKRHGRVVSHDLVYQMADMI